ncbi:gb [Venturia nashicola]|uniref:Translation initiation factor eIF2B subunit alpha n=1 Tax=Venturia nashicola TaxID=86259 RepID=A0A4Z1PPA3_9PEZI|nr:gb [Venturia nashicola]TLD37845.1 gb [Venturia nashicola]
MRPFFKTPLQILFAPPVPKKMAPPAPQPETDFDIVTTYRQLLQSDPELTMPVAAIESLVLALSHRPTSTISETLQYLEALSETLIKNTANPISLSAGTDLFQRYLISSLKPGHHGGAGDFEVVRRHLLNNGRLFVERAKAAREQIAHFGRSFVKDGCTVLTTGGSRVVGALLREAAEASGGSVKFKVIYVLPGLDQASQEGSDIVSALRKRGVPVATIGAEAVGYAMGKVDMVIVGAEGVVENGGVISRLGTYQIGVLAKGCGKPFYVVAESHKFVRIFPLGQYDLPIEQKIVDFKSNDGQGAEEEARKDIDEGIDMEEGEQKTENRKVTGIADAVDFSPPEYISGIITETGVLTPSAVSEELIKIWF